MGDLAGWSVNAKNEAVFWYYMSNYTIMEGGQRKEFVNAKASTLDNLT